MRNGTEVSAMSHEMGRGKMRQYWARLMAMPPVRGALAGALGGGVLTGMFWQAHGASLARYTPGNPVAGFILVWLLTIVVGVVFGYVLGERAAASSGFALGWGLLVGLGWFVVASCLVLPPLRGAHPFSLQPPVAGELVQYLVFGMLLGMGYYELPELAGSGKLEGQPKESAGRAALRR
jgi:hypothetical protein